MGFSLFSDDGCDLTGFCCPGLLYVDPQPHVCDQLSGGFVGRQVKQSGNEMDHIPFCLAAETDKILIDLHAWRPIIMKGAPHHPAAADLKAIIFGSSLCADLFFHF